MFPGALTQGTQHPLLVSDYRNSLLRGLPAASASSIALEEVMPLVPSAAGQSLTSKISTGRTSVGRGLALPKNTVGSGSASD